MTWSADLPLRPVPPSSRPVGRGAYAPVPDHRQVPGMVALTGVDAWYAIEDRRGLGRVSMRDAGDAMPGVVLQCVWVVDAGPAKKATAATGRPWLHEGWLESDGQPLSFEALRDLGVALALPFAVVAVGHHRLDEVERIALAETNDVTRAHGVLVRSQRPGWAFHVPGCLTDQAFGGR